MNVTDFQEVWQIDVGGQIYEANFDVMAQWIFEGSLLPQDLVRRGNLRWIEARKVPALMQFFSAAEQGLPAPVFPAAANPTSIENPFTQPQNISPSPTFAANPFQDTNVQPPADVFPPAQNPFESQAPQNDRNQWSEAEFSQTATQFNEPLPHEFNVLPTADFCSMHPDVPTSFLCGTCGNGFCGACPKSYGGSVKICPFCGALCKSVKEVQEKTQAATQYERDISEGFGFEDFGRAFAYPFKFKTSLIVGAFMFMLFSLGQGAVKMGGIFMAGSALISFMLSNMLTFGVMANTVENFAQGKIGGNFMPPFDDFNLWDDVVHPFFLSIGVYLISFGIIIVIAVGSVIWGLNQASNTITEAYTDSDKAKLLTDPNGPFSKNNPDFQKQKEFYGDGEMPDEEGLNSSQKNLDETEENVRRTNDLINQTRKKDLEAQFGKTPETLQQERDAMLSGLLEGIPGWLKLLLLIGFLWGIFYSPAACCVAGYTRSFVATMNPAIGLETIKLLGWDYFKLWFMGVLIVVASFLIGFVLAVIFLPFNLPTFGNLPANAIGALFVFYFSVVYSVLMGFVLYKNADKLNLFKG
jgi:hypothetical protein